MNTMSPAILEILGHTGMFDYVEFVAEYATFDLHALGHYGRTSELYNLPAIIKIDQEPRTFLAQRAVGSGFQGVLFADVRTVADAEEIAERAIDAPVRGTVNAPAASRTASRKLPGRRRSRRSISRSA